MDRSSPEYISQEQFLITELHYTLGQVRTQLGDLSPVERCTEIGGRTVEQLLQHMNTDELRFQTQYAQLLSVPVPDDLTNADALEQQFETRRRQTIELLRAAGSTWQPALLGTVQQQVHADRRHATAIATCHIGLRQ
ncbi:MAG TPA: hypothetical protein VF898_14390 [Chloroflexota bacterium]